MRASGSRRWLAAAFLVAVPVGAPLHAQRAVEKPTEPLLDRTRLAPDFEVVLAPLSSDAAPTRFTVRNRGLGDADRSSLVRVSVRVLPITTGSVNEALRQDPGLGEFFTGDGDGYRRMVSRCELPFSDFEAAVDPLRAGASQVVTPRSEGSPSVRVIGPRAIADALAGPNTNLPGSRLLALGYRIACVYEVRVVADADGRLTEADERNNEVVHRFERTGHYDILHYVGCEDRAQNCS